MEMLDNFDEQVNLEKIAIVPEEPEEVMPKGYLKNNYL